MHFIFVYLFVFVVIFSIFFLFQVKKFHTEFVAWCISLNNLRRKTGQPAIEKMKSYIFGGGLQTGISFSHEELDAFCEDRLPSDIKVCC